MLTSSQGIFFAGYGVRQEIQAGPKGQGHAETVAPPDEMDGSYNPNHNRQELVN